MPGLTDDRLARNPLTAKAWRRIARILGLSPRQIEIVRRIMAEQEVREIAASLGLTPQTIQTHIARLYMKLGVHTRAGLVVKVFVAHLSRNVRRARRRRNRGVRPAKYGRSPSAFRQMIQEWNEGHSPARSGCLSAGAGILSMDRAP